MKRGIWLVILLWAVTLAPDGTYVNGNPQATPDGKYVGDGAQ